ncbi:MAG: FAD-binding protein [Candidatus Bathyarchaeia archaeon]
MCKIMVENAKNLGIKFVDKLCVANLLVNENIVSGAVGFSLLNGMYYIIKAKAVILATGSQNYSVTLM